MYSTLKDEPRQHQIATHVIHEFDADLALRNMQGCYGAMMRRRYRSMLKWLVGRRVLDGGCGLGLFSQVCHEAGWDTVSIDVDDESLALARQLYDMPVAHGSIYDTGLPMGSVDSVALFDVIEHLDFPPLLAELDRLGVRRVLVYDSNLANPLLQRWRRRRGHEEHAEYTAEEVIAAFLRGGYRLLQKEYHDVLALPLSGGLQRPPVAGLTRLPRIVLVVDRIVVRIAHWLNIDRRLACRYLLVFDC